MNSKRCPYLYSCDGKTCGEPYLKNQWGGIPTVEKVVVGNAAKEATINYLTKVVTPSTTAKEDFSLPEITENTKYVSVIIPQEDVEQLTIVIGGKNFVY